MAEKLTRLAHKIAIQLCA